MTYTTQAECALGERDWRMVAMWRLMAEVALLLLLQKCPCGPQTGLRSCKVRSVAYVDNVDNVARPDVSFWPSRRQNCFCLGTHPA